MKMKMRVEINIPDRLLREFAGVTDHDLRLLLCDALGEFAFARRDAQAYVDRRYPGDAVYVGAVRKDKVIQVAHRSRIAEALRHAASLSSHLVQIPDEAGGNDDACPTCGNRPGDGVGCDDPNGCGYGREEDR
jgi:hypothetical protein